MSLSREEVQHIAQLARLYLTEDETATMSSQLSGILEHISVLQEVDVSSVPPSASVLPVDTILRADIPVESLSPDELLVNAPEREENFVRVKAVLE